MIRPGVLVPRVLAVLLGCGLAVGAVLALGAAAVTAPATGYAWKASVEVPGMAALNTSDAVVFSLSCGSPGNCAEGGFYTGADGYQHPFVVDEVKGGWGTAQTLPGSGSFDSTGSQVVAVSCPSAGECEAVGGYFTAGVQRVFADRETGGVWGTASELPGTAALAAVDSYVEVRTLSCPSAGNCTAGGDYRDAGGHTQPFVADETDGTWSGAQPLALPTLSGYYSNEVDSVSCAAPGDCAAAGNVANPLGSGSSAFVADETNGTWGMTQQILGVAVDRATVTGVSCGSAGNCAAVGQYATGPISDHAFVVDETAGTWGSAQELPGSAALDVQNEAVLTSVSCPSAGDCSAAGSYVDAAGRKKVLADSELGGVWATATALPAAAIPSIPNFTADSISCGSPGNCVAGGSFVDEGNDQYAFTVTQTGGEWGTERSLSGVAATSAPMSQVHTVSCVPSGPCAMGGTYWNAARRLQAWVANQVPATRTTLTQPAKSVSYGDEQAVHLSVAVTAAGGEPGGTVRITAGTATVCNVKLVAGAGGCALTARQLPPGTAHLTATYAGGQQFAASTSSGSAVISVTKEATSTAIGLSAGRATYGKEQAVRITVAVRPRYSGTVAGKVRIRTGSTTVCTITLSGGKGSCTLTARQLRTGKHILTAVYAASTDFAGSVSAAKTVTIAK